ncbi:MAG: hypothetical protein ACE361_13245 [Aureliella sp.]
MTIANVPANLPAYLIAVFDSEGYGAYSFGANLMEAGGTPNPRGMVAKLLPRLRSKPLEPQMFGKLNPYDLFSAFVPGILLIFTAAVLFPGLAKTVQVEGVPDAFSVIVLTVVAYFAGQVVQAISSLLEPLLHRSWGGRPSEKALTSGLGDRYLPESDGKRIAEKLRPIAGDDVLPRSLFLRAMTIARADGKSLEGSFNGAYAYHRALLTMACAGLLMAVASRWLGSAATLSGWGFAALLVGIVLLCMLLWHRCRQRANYYCREVLLAAERHLDEKQKEDTSEVSK